MENGAPPAFGELFSSLVAALLADPEKLAHLQARYYRQQLDLWLRMSGPRGPSAPPRAGEHDARFRAPEWRELAWFAYLRQSYALLAEWLHDLVEATPTDAATRRKLAFFVRQFISAAAPTNSVFTNPEAIRLALQTRGESLLRGAGNLSRDAAKGKVSMTDEAAFAVGRNLALTPGAVVFQNEVMQLLQYRLSTPKVHRRALLIVPPFINKYYILDLRPENSFVRHAIDNGLSVFMISWRNVPQALGTFGWDDYIEQGALAAIDVVRAVNASRRINVLGFCVGGTLLAAALAVLARRGQRPAASLTLLASLLDFSEPGDIGVYIDEGYVSRCEAAFREGGIVPGSRLANAFASLRPDDLVWRYVVANYLKGESPPAFDLLYWNSDSANLPGPLYAYYLRNMYLRNALRDADALTQCGVPVDLGRIAAPAYVLATAEDHIVPWRGAYASAMLLGPEVTFLLGASGHIAGVVSPPGKPRRSYRTGTLAPDADAWLDSSKEHAGSWWPHWLEWIRARSGNQVAASRELGNARYPPIEPAPGSYVGARVE